MNEFDYFAHALAGKALPASATPPTTPLVGSVAPVTAAVIAKPKLILATVNWTQGGSPRFSESKSAVFELDDRSARALRVIHDQLDKYVNRKGIRTIYLRMANGNGEHAPHLCHFKIEAALQLVCGLDLLFVNTLSVGAWVRRCEPVMPATKGLDVGRRWEAKLHAAVEAALFVNEHFNNERYFKDGSARRD